MYVYFRFVPRLKVDNRSKDENPHLYSNYIAQVKHGSSIEIAQEAAYFSNLIAPPGVREYSINAVHSSEFNIGSQIIEHYHAQIRTEITPMLQLKLAYLVSGSCIFPVLFQSHKIMSATFSESSPTVQSQVQSTE